MAAKSSKPKRGQGRKAKRKRQQVQKEGDILSPAALLNAQYTCHSVPCCLQLRGFAWPGSPQKKGKKRKIVGAGK